jgi:hypothetical protein
MEIDLAANEATDMKPIKRHYCFLSRNQLGDSGTEPWMDFHGVPTEKSIFLGCLLTEPNNFFEVNFPE